MQDIQAIRFVNGTKITHDYEGKGINSYSYSHLCNLGVPSIGIPAKQNRFLIIDVDVVSTQHKHDGREWWWNFLTENGIPTTYAVKTPSGGFHFYYKIPESVNVDTFSPPGKLADGVDVKWNGWVGSPPTAGYTKISRDIYDMEFAPPSLMMELARKANSKEVKTFDYGNSPKPLNLYKDFSKEQIAHIRKGIQWIQQNATLSREEWRNGIFALRSGISDLTLLEELVHKWSNNKAYKPGDEQLAFGMAMDADRHGSIGPGTIISIIKETQQKAGAIEAVTNDTYIETIEKAKVKTTINKDGTQKVEPSETNAAALLGALFPKEILYQDARRRMYVFRGKPQSDTDLVNKIIPYIQSSSTGLGMEKFRGPSIAKGLDILMASRQIDPHVEYLKGVIWDGKKRIANFFEQYLGVQDSEYIRIVSTNFWTSLAARGLVPGSKVDSIVVIEGHEGIAKSSLIEAIGGEYTFAPSKRDAFRDLESLRSMHQSIIVELPEMLGVVGEQSEIVKGFLSSPFDYMRDLFAKVSTNRKRGFILVGTTNSYKYLTASMGQRRFWPVKIPRHVRSINIGKLKSERDQLFAEAVQMFNDGHPYWYMPENLLDAIVETRVVHEPLVAPIRDMLLTLPSIFTNTDVYKRLESNAIIPRGMSASIISRIEHSLKRSGCEYIEDGFGKDHWKRIEEVMPENEMIEMDRLI